MDYEKKYNEALERASHIKDNNTVATPQEVAEHIFPELRESEDKRIRKEIIDFLETIPASELKRIPRPISEWFAWLEKQKEQHISWYDYQKSKEAGYTIVPNEEYEQLIKQKEHKPIQSSVEKEYIRTIKSLISDFIRGKCDIDAGYYQKIYDWLDGRHIESKPIEWNEEDENIRKQLISICDEWLNGGYNARPCLDDVRWLKNLLENQKEPTTVEWNEEDETIIEGACSALEIHGHTKLANKLKSLRPQPKQEWSEEDEKKILFLERLIKYHVPEGRYGYIDKSVTKLQAITMLKSLHPSWKPSAAQMIALDGCLKHWTGNKCQKEFLESLYEQLKKL